MPTRRDAVFSLILVVVTIREIQRSSSFQGPSPSSSHLSTLHYTTRTTTTSPPALANIPKREMSTRGSEPNSTLPMRLSENNHTALVESSFTVDLLSIGSQARPDYLATQEHTFARHSSVRNFIAVTEEDDTEPNCTAFLSHDEKWRIPSGHCFGQRSGDSTPYLLQKMARYYRNPRALEEHAYPAAWLCAQKRPIYGLLKAMRLYRSDKTYPDYLVIMDDDTYINLEIFEMSMKDKNPDIPIAYGGDVSMLRITRKPPVKERFFFAYGGFGLIFSRGVLENMVEPIHCQKDGASRTELERVACERLNEDNIGEKQVFREGMSVLDLMEAYVNFQMFADSENWTLGYCLHSDWTLAHFVTYYEVSLHAVNTLYYDDYRHARLQKLDFMEEQKANPVCGENVTCCGKSAICHYQGPEDMKRLNRALISQAPEKYTGKAT